METGEQCVVSPRYGGVLMHGFKLNSRPGIREFSLEKHIVLDVVFV